MAQSILLSNSNSALLGTLKSTQTSNPYEYSVGEVRPFSGVQFEELYAEQTPAAGKAVTFNVSKIGYLRQCILKFTVDCPTLPAGKTDLDLKTSRLGAMKCISEITIMSNSRQIASFDAHSLQAAISDLPSDVRSSYHKAMHMSTAGEFKSGQSYKTFCAIPFASLLGDGRLATATHFCEPVRIKVTFSDLVVGAISGTAAAGSDPVEVATDFKAIVSNPRLLCRYDVLPTDWDDKVVESNYGDSAPLSTISYDYQTETSEAQELTSTGAKLSRTIQSNNVVSDIYCIVTAPASDNTYDNESAAAAIEYDTPLKLDRVSFKASGQAIIDCDAEYLGFFGRMSERDNMFSTGSVNSASGDPCTSCWVYKLQFGNDSSKTILSGGTVSMRELNNPSVEVDVSPPGTGGNSASLQGKKCKLHVCMRSLQVVSTNPANGKQSILLTN